jgi:hypothetical protein
LQVSVELPARRTGKGRAFDKGHRRNRFLELWRKQSPRRNSFSGLLTGKVFFC